MYFYCLQEPEFQVWFLVEIYEVGDGAAINQSARFANITMLESDDPRGLVYFAVGSRLPVATLRASRVTLQVYREGSVASALSVKYHLQVRCSDTHTNTWWDIIHGYYIHIQTYTLLMKRWQ